MLLNAVCPHCHDAELQYPGDLRGTTVACRRCGKPFLFQPIVTRSVFESDLPRAGQPAGATALAPAPVAAAPSPEPAVDFDPHTEGSDFFLWSALAGVGLFGPAIVATQFPYGRIVAAVLLTFGLIFTAVGLLGLTAKQWTGWLGLGANAVGLVLVVLLPGWLGISTWMPQKFETTEFKQPMAVTRDGPARPVSWVEAGSAVWEMGDARVSVAAAAVEPPPKPGTVSTAPVEKTPTLRLTVQLSNVGLARNIEFPGWFPPPAPTPPPPPGTPPPPAPKLTADGKPIPAKANPPGPSQAVHPGKSIDTVLLFNVPPNRGDLRLELPAEPFGGTEPVRFQIPWTLVTRQNLVPAKPTNP